MIGEFLVYTDQASKPSEKIRKKLNKADIAIGNKNQWQQNNMTELLMDKIKIWGTQKLNLVNNKHKDIILDLQFTSFPHLRTLSLKYNNILTLEGIQKLQCPNISSISLENNHLISVSNLRKTQWKFFQSLSIISNYLQDIKCLNKINFYRNCQDKLCNYIVEIEYTEEKRKSKYISEDNRWALKANNYIKFHIKPQKIVKMELVNERKQKNITT